MRGMEASDRPVIVVGCARSGTTLLQSMIHAHPRLAMPPENRFVMPLYRNRRNFGDLRLEANVDLLGEALTAKGTKIKDLGLAPIDVRKRLHETPATIGSMLGSVLVAYAEAHGRARWGDKRPNYIQFMDDIRALFPDAQFVHIIRDGRDSAASLLTMPWWDRGYVQAVHKWRHAIEAGHAASAFGPDSYYEFRYEDLVAEPEPTLRALCAYLGEDFDDAMLEPHRQRDITPDYKTWHKGLSDPVNAKAVMRWQRDLTDDQVALFERVAGAQLQEYGYELTLDGRDPSAELAAEWDRVSADHAAKEAERVRKDEVRAQQYPHPVAAILTSAQREAAAAAGWLADYDR